MKKKTGAKEPIEEKVETVVLDEEDKAKDSEVLTTLNEPETFETLKSALEENRAKVAAAQKKATVFNRIISIVLVAACVGGFILFVQDNLVAKILAWVLIGIALVGTIIYMVYVRKAYPKITNGYVELYFNKVNNYLFNQEGFTDCVLNKNEKYVIADIVADRVYREIVGSNSRNIVRGKYKGYDFQFGELALNKKDTNPRNKAGVICFLGRHISLANNMHFEGRYIVTISGKDIYDSPNDVEDLVELVKHDNFVILGPEGSNVEKDLGKDFIKKLEAIELSNALINVNIVFWAEHTACYLSYTDDVAVIPLEKPADEACYLSYKEDTRKFIDLLIGK